ADATNGLDAEGLEMLADSAWWMAEPDESLAARERAYAGFTKAGDKRRAATIALRIGQDNVINRNYAAAMAWLGRATQPLAGDEDCAAFGYLLFARAAMGHGSMSLDEIGRAHV